MRKRVRQERFDMKNNLIFQFTNELQETALKRATYKENK